MTNEWIMCGHEGCRRRGRYVIAQVDTSKTIGQTHDCCGRHRCAR